MKAILNQLIQHEQLTSEQARQVIINIADGKYNPSQIAAFLTVFMMRSISLEELEGFRSALLELCIAVDLSEFEAIDLCGTGGDEKNTFNISTLSAFVTAGAGVKVTKHGNTGQVHGPLQEEVPISMEYSDSSGVSAPVIICCVEFCHPRHHVVSIPKGSTRSGWP